MEVEPGGRGERLSSGTVGDPERVGRFALAEVAGGEVGAPMTLMEVTVPEVGGGMTEMEVAWNLNHVLQRIEGHFIRGYGDRSSSGRAEIVLLPGAAEAAQEALARDEGARARLVRVGKLIEGFETPHGMELLATVHWVATREPKAAEGIDAVIEGVARWNERKRQRFQPSHIRKAWERLRAQGWLDVRAGDGPVTADCARALA
jgi:hypothetical protein